MDDKGIVYWKGELISCWTILCDPQGTADKLGLNKFEFGILRDKAVKARAANDDRLGREIDAQILKEDEATARKDALEAWKGKESDVNT